MASPTISVHQIPIPRPPPNPAAIRACHPQADKPLTGLHLTTSTNMLYLWCFNRGGERNYAFASAICPPDGSVSARQPLSCFCSGGPSGPSFAHTFLCPCFFSTIPFRIRTYAKRACKPCRIRTSKTQHLKCFRIRTYEKTPGGSPCRYFVHSAPVLPCKGRQQAIQPSFRGGTDAMDPARNHWYIACHTEVSRRGNPPSPAVRACSSRGPTVSVSLTNHKRKASKHVQETHSRCGDCNTGVFGNHIPSRTRTNPSGKGSRRPISRENETRRPRRH
jgi:hypothetical protein